MYYVVSEVAFNYNDEVYYTGEVTGGCPIHVCTNKDAAEKKKKELSLAKLREIAGDRYESIGHYGYGLEEITHDEELFEDFWKRLTGETAEDNWTLAIPEDAKDEQLEELLSLLSIEFFMVTEVEA